DRVLRFVELPRLVRLFLGAPFSRPVPLCQVARELNRIVERDLALGALRDLQCARIKSLAAEGYGPYRVAEGKRPSRDLLVELTEDIPGAAHQRVARCRNDEKSAHRFRL